MTDSEAPAAVESARESRAPLAVSWVTNFDAPYRRPVWTALANDTDLHVWLLQGEVSSDKGSNRTIDWDHRPSADLVYDLRAARTVRVRRRGEAFYAMSRPSRLVDGVEAVILGGWESPAYWQIAAAARRRAVPVVGFYESHSASSAHTGGPVARARRLWFRRLDAVVVPGVASRRALLEIGVPAVRIIEGFNAVDVTVLREESLRARRGSQKGHRFLYVGQLIPRKNVEGLLGAFALVAAPDDTLVVAGQGPLRVALEAVARDAGISDRVRFVGHVPYSDLPGLFAGADTLVLPSFVEVWGLVVNEALACGLRVVVSDSAGVAPSVAGMPGVVLAVPTPQGIAASLLAARGIDLDPEQRPEILQHTPQAFARRFREAIDLAIAHPLRTRRATRS